MRTKEEDFCNACEQLDKYVVVIHEQGGDYHDNEISICIDCLKKAAEVFEKDATQRLDDSISRLSSLMDSGHR